MSFDLFDKQTEMELFITETIQVTDLICRLDFDVKKHVDKLCKRILIMQF